MQVWPSAATAVTDPADGMTGIDPSACYDSNLREVTVTGLVASDMLNDNTPSVSSAPACMHNVARSRALDNGSVFCGHIHAVMKPVSFFEWVRPWPIEAGDARSRQRPI